MYLSNNALFVLFFLFLLVINVLIVIDITFMLFTHIQTFFKIWSICIIDAIPHFIVWFRNMTSTNFLGIIFNRCINIRIHIANFSTRIITVFSFVFFWFWIFCGLCSTSYTITSFLQWLFESTPNGFPSITSSALSPFLFSFVFIALLLLLVCLIFLFHWLHCCLL